jgi:hypothetical protein
MRMIGYARVSSDGQSVDAQRAALMAAGAATVLTETRSGIDPDRKECPPPRNRSVRLWRRSRGDEGCSPREEPSGLAQHPS